MRPVLAMPRRLLLRTLAVIGVVSVTGLLAATPVSAGVVGGWTPAQPMSTAHALAVSAVLPGGDVLVAGGSTDVAEIYNPAADTWTTTAPMSTVRTGAAAVTLADGNVLVVGGTSSAGALDTGEVFDPAAGTWTPVQNTMSSARGGVPSAALLPDGDVLIAGGVDGSGSSVATADLYDPVTNTFLPAAPMTTARSLAGVASLSGGKVLVAGGQGSSGNPVASADVYDPATGTWSAAANTMSDARVYPGLAVLPSGKVMVAEGSSSGPSQDTDPATDIYDPATNSFTPGPPMAQGRLLGGMVSLPDGRVLVAGGLTVVNGNKALTGDTEIYDPATNAWSEAGNMPSAAAFTIDVLPTGEVLAAGGITYSANGPSTEAELYTPAYPPGAPVAVSATPGNHSAFVTFAPPVSQGGLPIEHYTIKASSGQTATTTDGRTFAAIAGLTDGRRVTFTVTATNALGTGPPSAASNPVVPMAPDRPPKLRILGLPKRLSLTAFLEGVRFSVRANKRASLQISLLATARGASIARAGSLTLASKNMGPSRGLRRVVLVPLARLVGQPRLARVELVIVAIDRARSRSTTSRWLTVTGPGSAPGSGAVPGPGSSAPQTPPQVSIPTQSATLTPDDDVPVRLGCVLSHGACTGTLTLWLAASQSEPVDDAVLAVCARGCRPLGRAKFHVHAQHTIMVQVHLSSYGRRLLAQQRTLRATAIAATGGGITATTITINSPSSPRR